MPRYKRRFWLRAGFLLVLYLVTWVGGWAAHAWDLEAEAQRIWAELNRQRFLADFTVLREGGPRTHVDWCFPVLPGLLVAKSWYSVSPGSERGGVKLVLFFGIGSAELMEIYRWCAD
jgi:hypothetical protein